MKPFVRAAAIFVFGLVLAIVVNGSEDSSASESSQKEALENDEESIKIYKRLIPADVLRGRLLFLLLKINQFKFAEEFTKQKRSQNDKI